MSRLIPFDNSYVRDLPGTFLPVQADVPPAPRLLFLNDDLAASLGLDAAALRDEAAALFSGARLPEGAEPIAPSVRRFFPATGRRAGAFAG